MKVSLIGMSNIGKSHLAKRLEAECGFTRIDCDNLIRERLGLHLFSGKESSESLELADWLGQPYSDKYADRSNVLLQIESLVMEEVLEILKNASRSEQIVIDTSGSVIYLDEAVISELRALTTIFYLDISPLSFDILFKKYCDQPKPVIWGDAFNQRKNEEGSIAVKRCYPDLLQFRVAQYQKLAHVILAFERHSGSCVDPLSLITPA